MQHPLSAPIARQTTSPNACSPRSSLARAMMGRACGLHSGRWKYQSRADPPRANTSLLQLRVEGSRQGGHVQLPHHVCCAPLSLKTSSPIPIYVLTIAETLCVEGTELTLGGDVIQPVGIRHWPGRTLSSTATATLSGRAPPAGARDPAKGTRHPSPETPSARLNVPERRGPALPRIVGTHIDHIAGNHWTAVHFVSQLDSPGDVPLRGHIPVNGRIVRLSHRRLELERNGRLRQMR